MVKFIRWLRRSCDIGKFNGREYWFYLDAYFTDKEIFEFYKQHILEGKWKED